MTNFHKEITVKYPTFEVPDAVKKSTLNPERLAEAMSPIPVRSHYHTSIEDGLPSTFVSRAAMQQRNPAAQPHQGPGSFPQPGTPAPSPPPTPPMKQKKQQYQTDQSRPFVFPFSRSEMPGPSRMVPFAIDEAEKLYSRHIHISLGLYQLQKTREDYIREESGLGMSGLIGFTTSEFDNDIEDAGDKAWQDYQAMDWRYEEQEMLAESKGDAFAAKAAKQARASLKRLYRVERVYVRIHLSFDTLADRTGLQKAILPYSQSIVVVLLKLLLATVTGNPAANANVQHGSPGGEVPGKSVCPFHDARLISDQRSSRPRRRPSKRLTWLVTAKSRLKPSLQSSFSCSNGSRLRVCWSTQSRASNLPSASDIIKFQHLATLLIDSNCLLLILKMFGFQDLLNTVQTRNEWEDHK